MDGLSRDIHKAKDDAAGLKWQSRITHRTNAFDKSLIEYNLPFMCPIARYLFCRNSIQDDFFV